MPESKTYTSPNEEITELKEISENISNDFKDISNCSDSSYDYNHRNKESNVSLNSFESFTSYETNFDETELKTNYETENIFDKIIEVFTVRRRKALIDIESEADLVSPEISEGRLFLGLSFLSCLMCMVCTILLYYQLELSNQNHSKIVLTPNQKDFKTIPSVTFIFNEGTIQNFIMDGLHIGNQSWTFKIPSGIRKSSSFGTTNAHLPQFANYFTIPNQCKPGLFYTFIHDEPFYYINYFPYIDRNRLHLIYNDGQKDVTFIEVDTKISHGLIRSSKVSSNYIFCSQSVRVGNQFWIFCGSHDEPRVMFLRD